MLLILYFGILNNCGTKIATFKFVIILPELNIVMDKDNKELLTLFCIDDAIVNNDYIEFINNKD